MIDSKTAVTVVSEAAKVAAQVQQNHQTSKNNAQMAKYQAQLAAVGQAVGLVQNLGSEVVSYLKVRQQEETKRGVIDAVRQTNLAKVETQKQFLRDYLDKTFDERKNNFNQFFEVLDKGLESGNMDLVNSALDNIVKLAQTSPLREEVSQVLAALEDDKVTEFNFDI